MTKSQLYMNIATIFSYQGMMIAFFGHEVLQKSYYFGIGFAFVIIFISCTMMIKHSHTENLNLQ